MSNQSKPLSIIYNHNSGFRLFDQQEKYEQLLDIFAAHDFETKAFEINDPEQFKKVIAEVLQRHQQSPDHGVSWQQEEMERSIHSPNTCLKLIFQSEYCL
jgi:hypothetical protein